MLGRRTTKGPQIARPAPSAHESTTAPATPSAAHASSTPTPSATEPAMAKPAPGMESPDDDSQDSADIMINIWLNFEGAHNLGDFTKPYKFISGWSSPSPDVYALTVSDAVEDYAANNGGDVETQLRKIGAKFKTSPVGVNIQPKKVHVSTEDGKHETTVR